MVSFYQQHLSIFNPSLNILRMNFKALLAFTVLATAPAVYAHQNLHEIYINGVSQGAEVCLRQPPSNSPVVDLQSTDIRYVLVLLLIDFVLY